MNLVFFKNSFPPKGSWFLKTDLFIELWKLTFDFVCEDSCMTQQKTYLQKIILQVRHLEMKKEKEVERENLVKFLLDAMAVQFRNPSIWN